MVAHISDPAVSQRGSLVGEPPVPTWKCHTRKRPRQDLVVDDDMLVDDYLPPVRTRKTKKANCSLQDAAQPYPSPDHFAGPSTCATTPKPEPAPTLYPIAKIPPKMAQCSKATRLPESDAGKGRFDSIQEQLARAQSELVHLKKQLELRIQEQESEKRLITQSMMLDIVCMKRGHKDEVDKLQRQKYYATQSAKEQSLESERHKKRAEDEKAKHVKLLVDLNFYRDEAEHLNTLNKVMEEDLDELRQIENEDRTRRLNKSNDLPPAYGSLCDEDRYPTPYLHKDGGSFDVAAFKRTVREDFMLKLSRAHDRADALRADPGHAKSPECDAIIFTDMSSALADSSRSLKAALDYAAEMFLVNTSPDTRLNNLERPSLSDQESLGQHRRATKRHVARRDFVAGRVAKTIIDLTWRVVSATELRPVVLRLSPNQKAALSLAYKEADDCLLAALRLVSPLTTTANDETTLLYDYQNYFTQITALRRTFVGLGPGLSYSLFAKSMEWLGDQIETERMNRANRDESASGEECPNVEQAGVSEVSSEMSQYESDSS